jgi:hypothetical protein
VKNLAAAGNTITLCAQWTAAALTGTAGRGETLTADTSALGGSGAISYQWKVSTSTGAFVDIPDETNSTFYVPSQLYLYSFYQGEYIKVSVTRAGYTGSVESAAVGPVVSR